MRCPTCQTDNRDGRKFCAQCGHPLALRCAACGARNEPGEKFCGDCGAALEKASSPGAAPPHAARAISVAAEELDVSAAIEGERKTVTALFADIKGSMELMEDLDPEEARAIVDPALKLMIDAVHRYDGYVVQSTGDGIFALFGAPAAHEDHPQRALYAALRMQEEIRRYAERLRVERGVNLQVRIGANTGEVVVRPIRTGAAQPEYTPIGHSTSLAARLQTLAAPGSVAISESLRRLVDGYFTTRPLGPARIKGVSELVNVYEVTSLGPLRTRLQRSAQRGLSRFVGRQTELDQLRRALELASAGRGQLVAVMGEAGVGKSRLFHEFKSIAQGRGLVLEAYSVSHGRASALLPIVELLRGYFGISAEDGDRQRREKVIGKVLGLDRSFEDLLPHLFAMLGLSEGVDPLAQMDAQVRRRRAQEAIKRLMLRESANQPLILILEDLHWIDAETQALLNVLVDALGSARILMLVNYRPEYHHEWGGKSCYAQLRLDPLGRESARAMLAALLGDAPEFGPLERLIIERTEGNPLFIEEMIQTLFEQGVLIRDGAVRLARPLDELRIPPTVEGILASRIDRLGADEKDLLQTLAVIGKEFTQPLIRCVSGVADDELARMLADLQNAEFIYEQPALPDIEYRFKHALTQQVAYNSVLVERRKLLHTRTAEAIESLMGDRVDDCVAELAHHYRRSANLEKALEYLQRAGHQAARRSANAEAIEYLTAALDLLSRLPEGRERDERELALQLELGAPLMNTRGFAAPEVGQAYARARRLCESIGAVAQLPLVIHGLWEFHEVRAEYDVALELAQHLLQLAQRGDDPVLLISAHSALGDTLTWMGQFSSSLAHCERAIELYDRHRQKSQTTSHGYDLGVTSRLFGALNLWYLGRPDRALAMSQEAIARARELAHPFTLAAALMLSDWLTLLRGDGQPIADESEAVALMTEHGFAFFLAMQGVLCGARLTAAGKAEEAVAAIRQGIEAAGATGAAQQFPFFQGALANAYRKAGRIEESLALLDKALEEVRKANEHFSDAELHRSKGEVLQMQGRTAAAEACFRTAIEIARGQGARSLELRASIDLARLLDAQGKRDEARAILAEIYGWFTEGFDTLDLKEARALLDRLQ